MSTAMVVERNILEVLVAAPLSLESAAGLLASVYGVAAAPLESADAARVRFELDTLPGSFPSKLTVYADPSLSGPQNDADLARAVVAGANAEVIASLPESHAEAHNPAAWLRYTPGAEPVVAYEQTRDDDGIDLS